MVDVLRGAGETSGTVCNIKECTGGYTSLRSTASACTFEGPVPEKVPEIIPEVRIAGLSLDVVSQVSLV